MDSNAIPNASSQDKAYAYLKEQIASFSFRPHQRIKALEIADQLGISRTPVKEALGRLEQEGLVARELGTGYVVQAITAKQVMNLYKVREALEVEAARAALPNVSDAVLARMKQILVQMESLLGQHDYEGFLRASRNFHNEIATASDNDVLQQTLAGLNDRISSIGSIIVKKHPPRARAVLLENRRILAALQARDPGALELAVRNHIKGAGDSVKRFMEKELHHLYFAAA